MTRVRLEGSYLNRAARERVYAVRTDFEAAPRYFPAVAKAARIVSRAGNVLSVEVETKAFLASKAFHVHMETTLEPGVGFVSTNVSRPCVEHEVVRLEEVPEATRLVYCNEVEIRSRLLGLLGGFLVKRVALRYWERAYVGRLREMLERGEDA